VKLLEDVTHLQVISLGNEMRVLVDEL